MIEAHQTERGTVARFSDGGLGFEAVHDLSGTTVIYLITATGARIHMTKNVYHAEGYSPAVLLQDINDFIGGRDNDQTH